MTARETKSRHQRDRSKTFHLTETKRKVIGALAEFYALTRRRLVEIIYGKVTPSTSASMRRTTDLLEAEGQVTWRMLANRIRRQGNQPLIFGLTKKGVALAEWEGFGTPAIKVFKPNSDSFLPHEHEITEFHFYLKQLCLERGWQIYWQQTDVKCTINPDAHFFIMNKRGERYHFFFEVEKTKPGAWKNGESKIMRNLKKYYDYFDSDACQKEWGDFRKFRVIILLRNDTRRANILKELAEKYKNRMFWLTTEPAYRENMGGEIFLTPKDYEKVAYSLSSL